MPGIDAQVHNRFKVFTAPANSLDAVAPLFRRIEEFVAAERIAPKSIGVEFLEASRALVLTLGYRADEPAYPVRFTAVSLGHLGELTEATLAGLEQRMGEEAGQVSHVICHELFVTHEREFVMIFLSLAS